MSPSSENASSGLGFLQIVHKRWFLVSLLAVLLVGVVFSSALEPVVARIPRSVIVAGVMFLMALTLHTEAIYQTIRRPGPALLATAVNLGVAPPLALVLGWLLNDELATGLVVAATVPCTLASATVWTRRAGGNDAVAILVTVITNLVCFLVTPGWLRVLVGTRVELDYRYLVVRLATLVVLPIVVAQLVRLARPIAESADRHKTGLSVAAQLGILTMVLVGAVACGQRLVTESGEWALGWIDLAMMLVLVVGLHLALLTLAWIVSGGMGFGRGDRIAVAISGSQKTLLVGLDIALVFGPLAVVPMVVYHFAQLILDTVIADYWRGTSDETARHGGID